MVYDRVGLAETAHRSAHRYLSVLIRRPYDATSCWTVTIPIPLQRYSMRYPAYRICKEPTQLLEALRLVLLFLLPLAAWLTGTSRWYFPVQ